MPIAVGIDVAKEFHWAAALDTVSGAELLSQRVDSEPAAIEALIGVLKRLQAEYGSVTIGIDVVGGIAALLTAMLHEAGFALAHVPHRPSGGNKSLKRVFYQSAFCSLSHPASRAF